MASLPEPLRERAVSIRQRLHVDTTGWRGTAEPLPMLPIVQDAVSRDRKLAIRYWRVNPERGTGPRRKLVDRVIDPLGIVAKGTTWYLVANTPRGFRTYRVSRIEHATLLDKPCLRPPSFDLAAHWKSSTEQFTEGWKRIDVTLRLEPGAAEEMKIWHLNTKVDEAATSNDPDGWVTMRVQFDAEGEATLRHPRPGPSRRSPRSTHSARPHRNGYHLDVQPAAPVRVALSSCAHTPPPSQNIVIPRSAAPRNPLSWATPPPQFSAPQPTIIPHPFSF